MINTFGEINKQAALNASRALSKLIDRPIGIEISQPSVKKLNELSPIVDPEEIVATIYLPITGAVKGATLLVFPKETSFTLSDLLVRRELGTTRKLSELDKSALKEVGNILFGNYLTVFSNKLQIKLIEHIPQFSFDMFGAITSQILASFAQDVEEALCIEIEFIFRALKIKGYLLLLFRQEEITAVLRSLKSPSTNS